MSSTAYQLNETSLLDKLRSSRDGRLLRVHVTNINNQYDRGMHRVSADAGGASLWFESPDIELRPAPEAFGCALLLPSLHEGGALTIDEEVSEKWLSNIDQLLDIFHDWWGYPKLMPKVPTHGDKKAETAGTGLFFSAGGDSFHTLLRSNHKVDLLVTVHGFDIELQDITRMAALRSSLHCVAVERGVKPIIIRTNFREHPMVAQAPWEHIHGGLLAAIGHLLSDSIDRMLVSSSYAYVNAKPWGSHWKTDPLWSSDRLQVVHFGAEFLKVQKIRAIAGEPLVRQHLRVCWENLSEQGNCSRCAKCIRTRLMLAELGELVNFPVLEGEESLARQIDALPVIKGYGRIFQQLVERGELRPDVIKAVRRLLKRTKKANSPRLRLAKNTFRKVISWTSNRAR